MHGVTEHETCMHAIVIAMAGRATVQRCYMDWGVCFKLYKAKHWSAMTVSSVTKESVRRQNRSGRTNFGSQNWPPLPILVPFVKMQILSNPRLLASLATSLSSCMLINWIIENIWYYTIVVYIYLRRASWLSLYVHLCMTEWLSHVMFPSSSVAILRLYTWLLW